MPLKWGTSQKLLQGADQPSKWNRVVKAGRYNNVAMKLYGQLGQVHLSQDDQLR